MRVEHLGALTGLRFIAALHVVLFHILLIYLADAPSVGRALVAGGHAGVSLFFILSGFVLAYTYGRDIVGGQFDRRRYAWARWARIYPVYLVALAVMLPWWIANWTGGVGALIEGSFRSVMVLTLTHAWVPQFSIDWNSPAWSLSVEAFFYLLFPLLLPLLWRLRARGMLITSLLLWAASAIVPLLTLDLVSGEGRVVEDAVNNLPILRLPEFAIGIVLAKAFLLVRASKRAVASSVWLVLGGAGGVLVILGAFPGLPLTLVNHVVLTPFYAAILVGCALGGGFIGGWLSSRPFVSLGEASYALYLLHFPVFYAMQLVAGRAGLDVTSWAYFAAYMIVVLLVSLATYRFIEEPARRWIRARTSASRPPVPAEGVETAT